jgi:hypothetical protein
VEANNVSTTTILYDRLSELPLIDAHTHLVGGHLSARGLHDVILYHMAISDLYAAGCPSGARLTEYPGWPSEAEAHSRIREALPYLEFVRNTWISHGIRIILTDLYGFRDQITDDNWLRLDATIRERADDKAWQRELIKKSCVSRITTEYARREDFQDRDVLQYALEWAFFTRAQWGEYDTALYELERTWGKTPESPTPIGLGSRPPTERTIRTLADVHEAMAWYVEHIPMDELVALTTHISTDIDLRVVDDSEMERALAMRDSAGPEERNIYASYVNEVFLTSLEQRFGDRVTLQFSFAAEPLPFETCSRVSQKTISQLAEMISRHPRIHFQCFTASRHSNQSLCTLCRELPNFSLAGYWWHNFFPSAMRQIMEERLEMLPVNKQVGFFSDAYCLEWTYAKSVMVKKCLSWVLADKVGQGLYDTDAAVDIARSILFDTPKSLLTAGCKTLNQVVLE